MSSDYLENIRKRLTDLKEFDQNTSLTNIVVYNYEDPDKSYACTIYASSIAAAILYKFDELYQNWSQDSILRSTRAEYLQRFTNITFLTNRINRAFCHLIAYDVEEDVWCMAEYSNGRVIPVAYFENQEQAFLFGFQYTWIWWYEYSSKLIENEDAGHRFEAYETDLQVLKHFYLCNQNYRDDFRARFVTNDKPTEDEILLMERIEYYNQHSTFRIHSNYLRRFESEIAQINNDV